MPQPGPSPSPDVSEAEVRAALARVLASKSFSKSKRLSDFLSFLVSETLAGGQEHLKESVVGVQFFRLEPGFDPKDNPRVRTEAVRLRHKLTDYYSHEGASEQIVITVPKGSYSAEFTRRTHEVQSEPAEQEDSSRSPRRFISILWIAAIAAIAIAAVVFVAARRSANPASSSLATASETETTTKLALLPISDSEAGGLPPYLTTGIVDDIKRELTRLPGLRVIAGDLSLALKKSQGDYRTLGKLLGVSYLVHPRINASDRRKVLEVELIRASDGTYEWSREFFANEQDWPLTEREVVESVAQTLQLQQQPYLGTTSDPEARNLYLQARYLMATRETQKMKQAIGLLQQAVGRDPNFALAYAAIAGAYASMMANAQIDQKNALPLAAAAAQKALELSPNLAEGHRAMGMIRGFQGQPVEMEQEMRKAIALNPSDAGAYHNLGVMLFQMGRFEEADKFLAESNILSPLNLPMIETRADVLQSIRRYDEAIALCQRVLASDPQQVFCYRDMAQAYYMKGQYQLALETQQKMCTGAAAQGNACKTFLPRYMGAVGKRNEALAMLAEVEGAPDVSKFDVAASFAQLGEKDKAFYWLDQSLHSRESWSAEVQWDTFFDSLRDDPRYQDFLNRLRSAN